MYGEKCSQTEEHWATEHLDLDLAFKEKNDVCKDRTRLEASSSRIWLKTQAAICERSKDSLPDCRLLSNSDLFSWEADRH